jgi:hypothetical protein
MLAVKCHLQNDSYFKKHCLSGLPSTDPLHLTRLIFTCPGKLANKTVDPGAMSNSQCVRNAATLLGVEYQVLEILELTL